MRRTIPSSLSMVSLFALAAATVPSSALAQVTTQPPGAPESSQQDDDPTAAPEADSDTEATAAESAAPLDTGTGENTIVVTGSRIARPEFSFPNPIQSYTSETIQQAGATNLAEFLVASPALLGSTANVDVAGSNLPNSQLVGVNLLDLRNLNEVRTLVLVNGRRHIAGYPGISSVDINTIPVDLIDRIDVLTGGTSAIYGADGVSGVVNFVLKRDFEGLAVRAQAGISSRGDAANQFISGTWGTNFADNRGNVALSYEFNRLERFSQRNRLNYGRSGPTNTFVRNPADFQRPPGCPRCPRVDDPNIPDQIPADELPFAPDLRWIDSSPGGAIDLNLDYYPDFTGEGTPYDRGIPIRGTAFTSGGSSTLRETYFGDNTPYTQKHNFNLFTNFEFTPAFRVFAEGKYVRTSSKTYGQPSFDFYTLLFPDNAFVNDRFASQIAAIEADCDPEDAPCFNGAFVTGRDNFDFGIRTYSQKRDTYRAVLGADGKFSDHLRYELSYTFGQVDSDTVDANSRISDRYFAAIDAVRGPNGQITCRISLPGETTINAISNFSDLSGPAVTFTPGQCVPLNILGEGSPSQAALEFILTDDESSARIRHHVLSGYVSGDTGGYFNLPGGPIGFALGAEYRKESSRWLFSELTHIGQLADSSQADDERGSFNVKEVFGEINVPIFAKAPFAETLAVGGAVRFSDYTTVGNTTSWSTNAVYAPVRDLSFRGTYSQAVRAPNINELFAGRVGTFLFITDPCGIDQLTSGTEFRQANCAGILNALGINPGTFDPANNATSPQNASIQGFTGGNPNLSEETAKTWTAGLVLRPRFIPGLNLAFDWYDIKIKDAVNTASATQTVNLCVDQPTIDNVFCGAVDRNPATGFVSTFRVLPQNVASFDTEGLDIAFNYRFAPFRDFGSFNLKVNGNYLHKFESIPTPGAEVDNDRDEGLDASLNGPFPRYSATGDLTWTMGRWTINYGINWHSKTRRSAKELTDANPDRFEDRYIWFKEMWEHQAQVSVDVDKRFNLYLGVNNLWDEKPDVGSSFYPVGPTGRYYYAGVRLKPF